MFVIVIQGVGGRWLIQHHPLRFGTRCLPTANSSSSGSVDSDEGIYSDGWHRSSSRIELSTLRAGTSSTDRPLSVCVSDRSGRAEATWNTVATQPADPSMNAFTNLRDPALLSSCSSLFRHRSISVSRSVASSATRRDHRSTSGRFVSQHQRGQGTMRALAMEK